MFKLGTQFRKPAAQWVVENPILLTNQIGEETDTLRVKQGNSIDPWNSLPYSTAMRVGPDGSITLRAARALVATSPVRFRSSEIPYPGTGVYPSTDLYPSV